MRPAAVVVLAAAMVLTGARAASAQLLFPQAAPRAGSWEVSGGVFKASGFSDRERIAELTRNGQTSGDFTLFTASGALDQPAGVAATVGVFLTQAIAIEAGFRFSQPELRVRLSDDFEDAPSLTASETLSRYLFTGSAVLHLRRLSFAGRRALPFVGGGAGYVRDLHERAELVETGTEYHAFGGVKFWLGSGRRRLGIRGQAGISVTDGGFDFRDQARTVPVSSVSLTYLF